jgi:hypothetical protein
MPLTDGVLPRTNVRDGKIQGVTLGMLQADIDE